MKLGIGVDIGGTHISSCAVDLDTGTLIEGTEFDSPVNSKGTKGEIFNDWSKPINQTINAVGDESATGLGFGMPGAFNYQKGIGRFAGNDKYDALYGVDIRKEFAPYLNHDFSEFRFINDATAFAVGTAWFGKAKHAKKSICITLGTGFGSAFIDDGVPIVKGGQVPKHGSLWHLSFKDSIADEYFSTRWFTRKYQQITGEKIKGVKEIIHSSDQRLVQSIMDEFAFNLAGFITPWIRNFKPDMLVVGGNISHAWNRMEDAFHLQLSKNGEKVKVEISELLESAAISGSARLLVDDYWQKVKDDLPEA